MIRRSEAYTLLALASVFLAMASCDLLCEKPFRVESWSPGSGSFDHADISLAIVFSLEPERARAENAFRLEAGGQALAGSFQWDGRRMVFSPFAGFSDNVDYRLSVGESARTADGLSLNEAFEGRFTTRDEDSRPRVIAFEPGDGATMLPGSGRVTLRFSEAVDGASLRDCLSLSPSVAGLWLLSPEGDAAAFTPFAPLPSGDDYALRVSAELKDRHGNRMGEAWQANFSVGFDREPPFLSAAMAVSGDGASALELAEDLAGDEIFTVNAAWERGYGLRLVFNEPVQVASARKALRCEGGPSLGCEAVQEYADSILFRFDEPPEWQSLFSFRLEPGLEDESGNKSAVGRCFRIRFEGPASRPPELIGLRLPLAPGAEMPEDRDLRAYPFAEPYASLPLDLERFPVGVPVRVDMELYLRLAQGASLDRLSIMESIRIIIENSALDLSVDRVRLGGLFWAPSHGAWSACAVATLETRLTNRASTGILCLSFAPGLRDSLGNTSERAQSLPLLK